jgi:hypothetical protein
MTLFRAPVDMAERIASFLDADWFVCRVRNQKFNQSLFQSGNLLQA